MQGATDLSGVLSVAEGYPAALIALTGIMEIKSEIGQLLAGCTIDAGGMEHAAGQLNKLASASPLKFPYVLFGDPSVMSVRSGRDAASRSTENDLVTWLTPERSGEELIRIVPETEDTLVFAGRQAAALLRRSARSGDKDSTLQAMYDRTRDEGFGAEVKRRIMLGTYVLSAGYYDAYYLKAQQVRTLLRRDYEQAFVRAEVIAMPTTPTPAFKLGEKTADPLQMYLADVFTVSANLAGLPSISVPCGFSAERLPIGLQLTGRAFDESTLLRAADAFQRDTAWHKSTPFDSKF